MMNGKELLLGTVQSKTANTLDVILDGDTLTTPAIDCCGASVPSRVVCAVHATQLLAIAVVGGGAAPVDYIVETGTSNGWTYQQYASGRITATLNYNVSCATAGQVVANVPLPKTMADTRYCILTQVPNWCIDRVRFNSYDRTTTYCPIVYNVANTDASTIDFMCTLDGQVA